MELISLHPLPPFIHVMTKNRLFDLICWSSRINHHFHDASLLGTRTREKERGRKRFNAQPSDLNSRQSKFRHEQQSSERTSTMRREEVLFRGVKVIQKIVNAATALAMKVKISPEEEDEGIRLNTQEAVDVPMPQEINGKIPTAEKEYPMDLS